MPQKRIEGALPRAEVSNLFAYFGALLVEWSGMSRERRRQLILAAADRYLIIGTEWRTRYPSGSSGESEIVAHVDAGVTRNLQQMHRDAEIARVVDGAPVSGSISEERLLAGLAVLGTYLGGDGTKAREARRIAQRAHEVRDEE